MYAPKTETFNLSTWINVDPKGFHRQVDRFSVFETEGGSVLYMARGMDHPKFGYLQTYLIPHLGLRANIYHFREDAPTEHIRYLDVATIAYDEHSWRTKDLYLDIVQRPDGEIVVEDTDELAEATAAGLISSQDSTFAMNVTLEAVAGISGMQARAGSGAGNPIDAWLRSEGIPIEWQTDVTLMAAAE